MEKLVNDENYQSLTSRLKKPTTSLTRLQREKSQDKSQHAPNLVKNKENELEPQFRPQISKNTDQLVENRKKRLQEKKEIQKYINKQNGEGMNQSNQVKASDKYLI